MTYLPDTLVEEETRVSFLYPAIYDAKDGDIFVELGTFLGGNLVRCINYAKSINRDLVFYGVDHYLFDNIGEHTLAEIKGYDNYYDAFMDNLAKSHATDDVTIIKMETKLASQEFLDGSIDILFIDDGHCYPHTKQILELWLPKMKKGGWIGGHDCPCDGVRQAVVEMFDGDWKDNHHSWWKKV